MIRIVFFGMAGRFSLPPLAAMLAAGLDIEAVIVPAADKTQPDLARRLAPAAPPADPAPEPNIITLAHRRRMPVWEIGAPAAPETLALLHRLAPDLIIVACFPYLFPSAVLTLPRHGCLNLHPSLLPAYRGPEPLFWIAYHDERVSGVTLHFLDEGMDSGDIVAQTRLERPDGLTYRELEQRCASAGAELVVAAVQRLARGEPLPRQPQAEAEASRFPQPSLKDFVVSPDWPARRAFNFLRGAAPWPLNIQVGQECFTVRQAKSYAAGHTLDQPSILLGDELWLQCQPGVLRAKVYR